MSLICLKNHPNLRLEKVCKIAQAGVWFFVDFFLPIVVPQTTRLLRHLIVRECLLDLCLNLDILAAALQLSRQRVRNVPVWCNSTDVGLNLERDLSTCPRHKVIGKILAAPSVEAEIRALFGNKQGKNLGYFEILNGSYRKYFFSKFHILDENSCRLLKKQKPYCHVEQKLFIEVSKKISRPFLRKPIRVWPFQNLKVCYGKNMFWANPLIYFPINKTAPDKHLA